MLIRPPISLATWLRWLLGISTLVCAMLLVNACTAGDMIRIATSKNPRSAAKSVLKSRPSRYKTNPALLVRDIRYLKRNFDRLFKKHKRNANRRWGKHESTMPSKHRYVKYTQNYLSRAIINFDDGVIYIETLDRRNTKTSLRNAIVTTLLTPQDPRAVDMFTAKTTRLSGKPYLYGLVQDHRGRLLYSKRGAENYADFLLSQMQQRRILRQDKRVTVYYVRIHLVNDHQHKRARRYAHWIRDYARQYHISRSLVYAIMATESNFNPYAVSTAPAYGLMQIVPHTGGRDAYQLVFNRDKIPSQQFLFRPRNNIRLGIAYIHLLYYQYLRDIRDPIAREYCTIAAYNTGAGNVLRAFARSRGQAFRRINQMSPSAVYRHLRQHLPYAETRQYVHKVVNARPKYSAL